jgi:hypothetical protein
MKYENLEKKYDYRIDVLEGKAEISYFTESIDLSKPTFVTFAPRYRQSHRKVRELNGCILTFPSHLILKITNYVRT